MRGPALLLPTLLWAGCSLDPRPLHYGQDRCTHCQMTLVDARFGAELVTPQGKRLPFDAIECLANYVNEQHPDVHRLWVVEVAAPETLRPIEEVVLYRSPALPSPMGMNLGAFATEEAARQAAPEGDVLRWEDILRLGIVRPDVRDAAFDRSRP